MIINKKYLIFYKNEKKELFFSNNLLLSLLKQ